MVNVKLPIESPTSLEYGNPIDHSGDSLRSFEDPSAPSPATPPNPLTFRNLKQYVTKAYKLDESVAALLKAAAKSNCYRCRGTGFQWKPRGHVARRCTCVKAPEA